jgi:hypothetical protein
MEPTSAHSTLRHSRRRAGLLLGLVLALVAAPAIVLASHQFTDVPNSNPFHAQVDALVNAGITAGCTATTYCPNSAVTRGQMAAFMNRGLPYTAGGFGFGTVSEIGKDFIATVTVPPRAQSGGVAYVEVNASVNVFDSGSCPCGMYVFVADLDSKASAPITTALVPAPIEGGTAVEASVDWVFEVPTGVSSTFGVAAFVFPLMEEPPPLGPGTDGVPIEPELQATLVAQYTPFGSLPEEPPIEITSSFPGFAQAVEEFDQLLSR